MAVTVPSFKTHRPFFVVHGAASEQSWTGEGSCSRVGFLVLFVDSFGSGLPALVSLFPAISLLDTQPMAGA
ncbi:hypothetical protein ARMGADRAFT_391047 [Armillaria gallica]|uniref:Uncharacterized protein n=1 Tax=Armillaria gallica TaxID=47427 RepID=A0A2H3EAF6_ARMGA|nr:hypothetical protein ARMGADRAFT_391047 [Armillaria gallica]